MNNYFVKRGIAFAIDLILISIIAVFIGFIPWIEENNDLAFYGVLFLFFCKDLTFNNGSLGKKIMNLKLEVDSSNSIIVIIIKFLRNITLIIWPIESIVVLFSKKRIADYIFKSNVKE